MTIDEALTELLIKHQKFTLPVFFGLGTATDITEDSCTVERNGRPPLYEVRFQAGGELLGSNYTLKPKEGSTVLYAVIDNQLSEAALITCSEIDKATIKISGTVYEVSEKGHLIKRGDDTLNKIIADFITEVQKIIVIQGTTPDVPALTLIKNRLTNLLQ